MTTAVDVNRPGAIAAYSVAAAVGVGVLNVAPLVVGAYVDRLGLSASAAGYAFSAEMLGFTVGALLVLASIRKFNWRTLMSASLGLMLAGNAASALAASAETLVAIRAITGIGAGALMSMTVLAIGMARHPERGYGYWDAAQLALGAAHSLALPRLLPVIGLEGFFLYIGGLAGALMMTRSLWPCAGAYAQHRASASLPGWTAGACGLAAILLYQSAFWGVFAYLERIGTGAALSANSIGEALFAGQLAGLTGALLAVGLGARAGRFLPLALSLGLIAAACGLLALTVSAAVFIGVAMLLNFGFYWSQPYSTAAIARIDTNGRLVAALSVVLPLTAALGPALAATVAAVHGYATMVTVAALGMPVAAMLLWPITRTTR